MDLYVIDGGLYIGDTGQGRPVTQDEADKQYRDAYRELFAILEVWPVDGKYTFKNGAMLPLVGNSQFKLYLSKISGKPGRKWMRIRKEAKNGARIEG